MAAEGAPIGWLPPEAEVRAAAGLIIPLSAEGSRFAADYGTVTATSHEAREQARLTTEGWRRQVGSRWTSPA